VVCEFGTDKLVKADTVQGTRTVIADLPAGAAPYAVTKDKSGLFLVTESGLGNLVKIDPTLPSGSNRTVIASGLSGPRGVVFDESSEDTFVIESGTGQILKIPAAGAPITSLLSPPFSSGDGLQGLALRSSGSGVLWFAAMTADKLFFEAGGVGDLFDFSTAVSPGPPRSPEFVAVEADDRAIVSEPAAPPSVVPALVRLTFSPAPPAAPDPGMTARTVLFTFVPSVPRGIVVESTGMYVICENGPDVLSRIEPGTRTVIFTGFPAGSTPAGITR